MFIMNGWVILLRKFLSNQVFIRFRSQIIIHSDSKSKWMVNDRFIYLEIVGEIGINETKMLKNKAGCQ